MKYGELNLGQVEAIVNKLGGMESALKFLRGELVVKAVEFAKQTFTVLVDCTKSFADMVKAGNYDWAHSDITEKNFPVQSKAKGEKELHLIHFNKVMKSEVVLQELEKQNLEPARIEDLLAFGANHPDFQRQFPIVALGSVWQDPGGLRYVPYLWSFARERRLYLDWFEYGWYGHCRFLAVSKPA